MAKSNSIYRVIYSDHQQVYELYCRNVYQSEMYGFVQVEDYVFGEKSQLLVDPGEEKLKQEFNGVSRSFIPVHSIIRIDQVSKEGPARVLDGQKTATKIHTFPAPPKNLS